jgi:hypothetical protein
LTFWWERDPRYRQPGWTVIHDSEGTRFVRWEEPKKKRRPARALRFPDLKVGDGLIMRGKAHSVMYAEPLRLAGMPAPANDDMREIVRSRRYVTLALCTDRWQDPVYGQLDPIAGDMVGLRWITNNGMTGSKLGYPIRALAKQGYWPATPEQTARIRAFVDERGMLIDEWTRGLVTPDEVKIRATPIGVLMRDLGLDGDIDPV